MSTRKKCLTKSIIYKAEVIARDDGIKECIRMTANSLKERFNNHKKSFNDPKYENETELSKNVSKLKHNEKKFKIRW